MTLAEPHDPRALEALLAFWAEAGVDACLGEAPVDRLAAPLPAPPPVAAEPAPRPARRAAPSGDLPVRIAAAAEAAADLDALAEAARALFPGPRPPVLWEGPASARLLVVGDAPSAEDEAEGAPFRGPRGALVRALLRAAGLEEGALFVNTVFRRPHGGAEPSVEAQALAAPVVARVAALARPQAALLLGGCAVRGTVGDATPILRLRGSRLDWRLPGGDPLPALASLGPDFLLKSPLSKREAWADILSLAAGLDQMTAGR